MAANYSQLILEKDEATRQWFTTKYEAARNERSKMHHKAAWSDIAVREMPLPDHFKATRYQYRCDAFISCRKGREAHAFLHRAFSAGLGAHPRLRDKILQKDANMKANLKAIREAEDRLLTCRLTTLRVVDVVNVIRRGCARQRDTVRNLRNVFIMYIVFVLAQLWVVSRQARHLSRVNYRSRRPTTQFRGSPNQEYWATVCLMHYLRLHLAQVSEICYSINHQFQILAGRMLTWDLFLKYRYRECARLGDAVFKTRAKEKIIVDCIKELENRIQGVRGKTDAGASTSCMEEVPVKSTSCF